MLAERRRRKRLRLALPADSRCAVHRGQFPVTRVRKLVEHAEVFYFRVFHRFGDGMHDRGRHVVRGEPLRPDFARLRSEHGPEHLHQRFIVLDAPHSIAKARVLADIRAPDRLEQRAPEFLHRGDVDGEDLAVRAGERERERDGGARLGSHNVPRVRVGGEGIGNQRHARLDQGDLDARAPSRALALVERSENSHAGLHAAHLIGKRRPQRARVLRIDEEAHQARERLPHGIVCRPLAVRAVLGEPGDRAVDEAGVHRAQGLVIETEPLHHPRPEILQHHVGLPRHPAKRLLSARRIEVQGDAQLVAVECAEVVAVTRGVRIESELAECVPAPRPLDLDDPGAEIGELQPRVRARDELPQLENADAFQRARHARSAVSRACRSRAPGDTPCRRGTASFPACVPARGRENAFPSLSP